jgi:hypothetical protein
MFLFNQLLSGWPFNDGLVGRLALPRLESGTEEQEGKSRTIDKGKCFLVSKNGENEEK